MNSLKVKIMNIKKSENYEQSEVWKLWTVRRVKTMNSMKSTNYEQ
jgi:hypothetical protein